jgi:hypothetical protein
MATAEAPLFKPFFDDVYFSRIGFIFICFVVVSSGYISEILSCQTRYVFETNPYFRHLVGVLVFFVFIMLEGGWSFNTEEDDKAPNNWSSGNVIDTLLLSFGLYAVFLLSSKSQFIYNISFFLIVLGIYFVNTQRSYYLARKSISEETNSYLLMFETAAAVVAGGILVYGFGDYYIYQVKSHPNDFSLVNFLLGSHKCQSVESIGKNGSNRVNTINIRTRQ